MKNTLSIICIIIAFAWWTPASGQTIDLSSGEAPATARDVSGEMAVRDSAVTVLDVTGQYAGRAGGSRDAVDLYFISGLGGAGIDSGRAGALTSDDGAVFAGYTYDVVANEFAFVLVKYDHHGEVEWASIAGDGDERAFDVCETADGGYAVVGVTRTYGAGSADILLVKFDHAGAVLWARALGGTAAEVALGVCETAGGDLVLAGHTTSFGTGDYDGLLVEFDSDGTLQWSTLVSGAGDDILRTVQPTADGGLICSGATTSFGAGDYDAWLLRFDQGGGLDWAETLGGAFTDEGRDAIQSSNGDYVLAGYVGKGAGNGDLLLAIFNEDATLASVTTAGGSPNNDHADAVCELADGSGYAAAGATLNYGDGGSDAYVVAFDTDGAYRWARVYGGMESDNANDILALPSGGFVLVGETGSFGAEAGVYSNFLLVVADNDGLVPGCEHGGGCYPNLGEGPASTMFSVPDTSTPALALVSPVPGGEFLDDWLDERVCDYTPPEKQYWLAADGDIYTDSGEAIGQTPDGGFIVAAGATGYMTGTGVDVLLLKYGPDGTLQWARVAGGDDGDFPRDLAVTEDGGCIVAGSTLSFGADAYDAMVLGFDPGGDLNWARAIGGTGSQTGRSIRRTPGGDYLVAGGTETAATGDTQAMAFAVDAAGNVQWVRAAGAADRSELACCGIGTADGGTLLAGSYGSGSSSQGLVIKLDAAGNLAWNNNYGSGGAEVYNSICAMPDGNFVLGGQTTSYGGSDAWLTKINGATGARMWVRSAGTAQHDEYFVDMRETADGGIVAAGYVLPLGGAITHALLCKFDGDGVPVWAHGVGDDGSSDFLGVLETADGGYAAAGTTTAFGAGSTDVLVIHADRNGRVGDCPFVWEMTYSDSLQYPPSGGYAMTCQIPPVIVYYRSPAAAVAAAAHEELCSALPTVGGTISCTPEDGTAPFVTHMRVELDNNYGGFTRRMAAVINVRLANGAGYSNWRTGYTNIAPGGAYVASWNQNIPATPPLNGESRFTLLAEDVTPAPYNQPPYPPSGDTDSDIVQIRVTVP